MTSNSSAPFPPYIAISLGIAAASAASIFIRFAQGYAPSLVIAAYRLALASLILLPLLFWHSRVNLQSIQRRQWILIIISGVLLAIHFGTWITSLEYTSVASSVILVSSSPLFVALLSSILLQDKLNRTLLSGMAIAVLGTIIVGLSDACALNYGIHCPSLSYFTQGQAIRGDLLALSGAIAIAGYILIGRYLRPSVSLLPYITLAYSIAAFVLILTTLVSGLPLFGYPRQAYMWFLLLAFIPQLLAHSAINWSLRYLSATFVSISLLGEPICATILAYLVLGEQPNRLYFIGALLILVGVIFAAQKKGASDYLDIA